MFEKYLQDIGLSDKESIAYLALLQVDNASVLDLSKKTKLNRSTTYVILESLAKKGLVSETTVGKKTHYQAESPERLRTYVERRKIEFQEMEKKLEDVIPQFKSISRDAGEKPVVKYFEGRDGIISAIEDFFRDSEGDSGGFTYLLYPKDLVDEVFTDTEKKRYRDMRLNKNIKSKVIYTSKETDRPSDKMGDRIKVDGEKYPITCDISIYKDRVRISVLGKELSSVFIKSHDVAQTLQSLFSIAFDRLK